MKVRIRWATLLLTGVMLLTAGCTAAEEAQAPGSGLAAREAQAPGNELLAEKAQTRENGLPAEKAQEGAASEREAQAPVGTSESEDGLRDGEVAGKAPVSADGPLREDKSVYSDRSEQNEVVTMYLTVREGNAEDCTDHTWTEVNTYPTEYYTKLGIDRYACEAILQVGDENGPVEGEFGYGETVPNATVKVRGQTSSRNTQKNYKIRIKDGKGTYKDLQTIPLNKMYADRIRFRNKLAFDLMQQVPQMTAIRTQFVHLYVKDETEGGSGEFEDYGLYTRMEQMNRRWLESRGLDKNGQLYKINTIFEWYAYEPLMSLYGSPEYSDEDFEYYLEVKGDTDNSKLREVLTAVNDYTVPIEEVVEKYFDVENISYFLAFHTLIGNTDVGARNGYLYSPLNSEKWYILSWDCDGSFKRTENELEDNSNGSSWERNITKFLGVVLYNRFLRVPEYRDRVYAAMTDLMENYLTEEIVREKVETYKPIISQFVTQGPDSLRWGSDMDRFNTVCDSIYGEIQKNYDEYPEEIAKPWPFFAGMPESVDGRLKMNWDASYDINGEEITYTCILARDAGFTDIIAQEADLRVPEVYFDVELRAGTYFLRVFAKNESGYTQDCFDYYDSKDPDIDGRLYGCKCFSVNRDGTFTEYINEE